MNRCNEAVQEMSRLKNMDEEKEEAVESWDNILPLCKESL
jgi:hypothetical protein